jgi:hypothetical protein
MAQKCEAANESKHLMREGIWWPHQWNFAFQQNDTITCQISVCTQVDYWEHTEASLISGLQLNMVDRTNAISFRKEKHKHPA